MILLNSVSCLCFLSVLLMVGCVESNSNEPQESSHAVKRNKRQLSIGASCLTNIDCGQAGMYCDSTRRCGCLSTYVNIGGSCWQKINPDEGGCTYTKQCSAVWPNSYCNNGQCRCANGKNAFQTNEGKICLNYDQCPTNGNNPMFVDTRNGASNPVTCSLDIQCPPGYECFCSKENCSDVATVKYCCPMRGLTCVLGYDEGHGALSGTTRYYFNPTARNCQPFNYRGNGGNANHFETIEQCDSYCNTYCKRGDPELSYAGVTVPIPSSGVIPKANPKSCQQSSDCADTTYYECQTLRTNQYCCPKADLICTQSGGLYYGISVGSLFGKTTLYQPVDINGTGITAGPVTIFDQGLTMPSRSSTSFSRFYYNPGQKRCLPFTYYGQGGNLNHFLTQTDCASYCSKILCTVGEPLRDATGLKNLECTSGSTCPSTHSCASNGVCCPSIQTVCSLGRAAGTCSSYVEKWWYNAGTGNCQSFLFSGCHGNANRFDTYFECTNACRDVSVKPICPQGEALTDSYDKYLICGGSSLVTSCPGNYDCYFDGNAYGCCPTVGYTCSQSYDQGTTCGPGVTRWYFNTADYRCYSFEYNGCDGNPNNFATRKDCENYCGVGGCPDGGLPYRSTTGQYAVCGGTNGCLSSHYCTSVTLGNNRNTYNYCCPTKATMCSEPRDAGQQCTLVPITRFYFNVVSRNCESFNYNGCGGNENSFQNQNQCFNFCNSAGCSPGTVVFKNDQSGVIASCDMANPSSCPQGYYCTVSAILQQNICCGAPYSNDKCPVGQSAYYDAYTNSELQCQANIVASCPAGYGCYYSTIRQGYYCCGTSANQCPLGGSVYIETGTGTSLARRCTPGLNDACPNGYSCQATNINVQGVSSTTGFCCGRPGICSDGAPQLVNNQPVSCSVSAQSQCDASQGYQCVLSSVNQVYYCCKPNLSIAKKVCGLSEPYIVSNSPVLCTQGTTTTRCPSPYRCTLYGQTNTFYCCGSSNGSGIIRANNSVCPPSYNPALTQSAPPGYTYCSPTMVSACSTGSYCLLSTLLQRFICCFRAAVNPTSAPTPGPIATCPGGSRAVQSCGVGIGCPSGSSCVILSNGGQFCCNENAVVQFCPNGLAVQLGIGGSPQSCQPSTPVCIFGFSCQQNTGGQFFCCQSFGQRRLTAAPQTFPTMPPLTTRPVTNRPAQDQYGCATGVSYLYLNTSIPLACLPNRAQCPAGYVCSASLLYRGSYQCCSIGISNLFQPAPAPNVRSSVVYPGDSGCITDSQCQASGEPYSRCQNGMCLCSSNRLVFQQRCVDACPYPYFNSGGVCTLKRRRYHTFNTRWFS